MNYSVTDIEPSSTDLITSATTACTSSGGKVPLNATPTTSIQDAATEARIREPSNPPAYIVTLDKIDPRLLPQQTVSPVQDGAICSSTSPISITAPSNPISPTVSHNAHNMVSAHGMTEVEDHRSLDEENTYLLEGGHSLQDVVTTQGTCQ